MKTLSKNPVINDILSVRLVALLDEQFRDSDSTILNAMVNRKLPKRLPVSMGLRTRAFDRYVSTFISEHPDAIIINLGCGLDTRFSRVDNGTVDWYNVDLAPVIDLREALLPPGQREKNIPSSVLDFAWMRRVVRSNRPVLIYAEGLFMYLNESGVKELLLNLQKTFPNSELVAEVFNYAWIKRLQHHYVQMKFKRQLPMDKSSLFTYGVKNSHDFEAFGPGFKLLDEWSYFDENEKKLGLYNFFGKFNFVRMMQWTVHYQIDNI